MSPRIVLILILLLIKISCSAQVNFNRAFVNCRNGKVFVTRFNTNLSIKQYVLNNIGNYPRYFFAGHSSICDSAGRLLLLSDGYNVYDSTLNFLDGGYKLCYDDLYDHDSSSNGISQCSIFLPFEDSIYYMINLGVTDTCYSTWGFTYWVPPDRLLYHKIDMKANNGAGKVVQRMGILDSGRFELSAGMMACKHGNGKDWWLIKPGADKSKFYTYLITKDSVVRKGVQSFAGLSDTSWFSDSGQTMFNNEGTKMVTCRRIDSNKVYLFDFDRCNGMLSNGKRMKLPSPFPLVGLCFSPNDRFLYGANGVAIFQKDLQEPDTSAWYTVAVRDTIPTQFTTWNNIYPEYDGKIYIGHWDGGSQQMSVINKPNLKGIACEWCPKCLRFDSIAFGGYSVSQPSCMPNYNLGAVVPACEPLAISQYDNEAMSQLEVFPNPASSMLDVRCSTRLAKQVSGNTKVEMYNSVGQVVYISPLVRGRDVFTIDVSHLPKGMYYLKVGNQVRKVIIE
jgi:hypothetical protein